MFLQKHYIMFTLHVAQLDFHIHRQNRWCGITGAKLATT